LDPEFHDGGAPGSTRSFDLASRLVASGHKVTVLTTTWERDGATTLQVAGIDVKARRSPIWDGISLPAVDMNRYARWAVLQMWGVREVDAVVAAAEPYGFIPFASLFAAWRGIPLIADVREIAAEPPPPQATRGAHVKAWLARWMRRLALKLPRRVLAASQAVTASLVADGIKAERHIQAALGSDTRLFAFPPGRDNTFLQTYPDLAGRPLMVFAGRFTADRDLIAVVNLAAALKEWAPDVAVVLCGDGPTQRELEEHARTVGVLDNALRIIAPRPRRELPDLYAAATLVLFVPRKNDTCGGFYDALAAGRPVLAFGNSWQRNLIESRGAGFGLPGGDPRTVAKEVTEILRDADGLRRAGQQAAALAASRFNLDRIIGEQRVALENLVDEEPRAVVLRRRTLRAKRTLDVVVSATLLILLSPFLLALAIVIGFQIGWPPVETEERIGLKGRPFKTWRFRTLNAAEDPTGALLPDAARLTPLGRALRRSGADAVLQLINVLIGTMSLVGPEPLPPSYLASYTPAQRRRHDVRPGMTGLAQVEGRTLTAWEEIFARDLTYVDHLSFTGDLALIFKTLLILARGGNIATHGRDALSPYDEIVARREGAEDV
jgi:lipopolysaccharide/colanic/teichoic acid biosynthesis glycosyltransferase/glycosyltransferase involved in cell wall biosynthesis